MITAGSLDQAIANLPPWALVIVVVSFLAFLGWVAYLVTRGL